jgi:hypothetical protein
MNFLRCTCALSFAATLALGQSARQSKPTSQPEQPEALARSLYTEALARHPHGVLIGADMKAFAPYLSKALLRKIEIARSCSVDADQQVPALHSMVAIGLFTGKSDGPQSFQIEKTQFAPDGSRRVYVKLTWTKPPEQKWTGRVAALVVHENDHYVIDDVIYVNDSVWDHPAAKPADWRLSDYLSAGCYGAHWIGPTLPKQPEALTESLYREEIARRPVGIPSGADWKAFAPYLSKALLHRMSLALDCAVDWYRQNPNPNLKPEYAWLELGIFSGGDDEVELRAFQVERTESESDGSFRVVVGLKWGWPPEETWTTRVAAILVPENGRLVMNDVVYLKDNGTDVEYQLSKSLSAGCDGPHWIGYGHSPNSEKQYK